MKKTCLLLLLSPLLLAMTCDEYDPAIGLEGQWTLINISNGFSGTNNDFDEGLIIWDFEEYTNRVKITDNSGSENYYGPSGSLNYSLGNEPEICEYTLRIRGIDYGCIDIVADTLRLSKGHIDGDTFTFVR